MAGNKNDREKAGAGGWPGKKYYYFSWVLSAGQFRKYYDEVELVTDEAGYDLLINKLELPYSSIKLGLDALNEYDANLWAIGKIHVYGMQDKPFIHADGDVFIWKKFNPALENAALICQGKEEGVLHNKSYWPILMEVAKNFNYFPSFLYKAIDAQRNVKSVNAGILGGHDVPFLRAYAKAAFQFVDQNLRHLHKIEGSTDLLNIVFEQFLFRAMCEDKGEAPAYLNPAIDLFPGYFADYTGVPAKMGYMHPAGMLKRVDYLAEWLEYQVQTHYPRHYYRIINLIRSNEI